MKISKIPPKVEQAFESAKKARLASYSPYSNFKVGAALVTKSGKIVSGCNVENASYGGAVCAERIAIFKSVSEGEREFDEIVVVTDAKEPAFPCAFCLQIMAEFFEGKVRVWIADTKAIRSVHKYEDLLPMRFGPRELALGTKGKK